MPIKVAIGCILLSILCFNCHTQDKKVISEDIELINLKSDYNRTDKFSYQLINHTENNYEYYVGLEVFSNNSWDEVVIDVDSSAPDKSAIVKNLLPKQDKKDSIYLTNYFTLKSDNTVIDLKVSKYRFILNFCLKNQVDFTQKYSKDFLVK